MGRNASNAEEIPVVLVVRELPRVHSCSTPHDRSDDGFQLKQFMYEYFQLQYSLKGLRQND
jgi:hypothetical protein